MRHETRRLAGPGMTEVPAISVVLPTYNHLRFLPDAIADIVAQTRADWELIVVDDGSTDGTPAWLEAARLDARVRVLRQERAGPDQAINAGVRAARGAYLTWVSADNRSAPYLLEALGAALDAEPAAQLAYSPYYAMDASDRVVALKFDNVLLLRELVTGAPRGITGFMYRRSVHETVGEYGGWACDTRMWASIVERFPTVFVLEPTCYYRFHDDRSSVRERARLDRDRPSVLADFLAWHDAADPLATLRLLYPGLITTPAAIASAAADAAVRLARAGAADMARSFAQVALRRADSGTLLGAVAAAISTSIRTGADPVGDAAAGLMENPGLRPEARDAAVTLAIVLAELAGCGGFDPLADRTGRLDAGHPLCLAERPRVFSFAAWKLGHRTTPLPAF